MEGWSFQSLVFALQRRDSDGNPTSPSSIKITPTIEIALIAGGGGLLLIILILVVWCVIRRRRKKRRLPAASSPEASNFFDPNALPQNPLASEASKQHSRNVSNISNPMIGEPNGFYNQPSLPPLQTQFPSSAGPVPMYANDISARSQTPVGGSGYVQMQQMPPSRGVTPAPQEFDLEQQQYPQSRRLSQRRGNEGPAPLKLNTRLRAPSGVGMERVNATAWGAKGRHMDGNGMYYGSLAQQGGYAPAAGNKRLPPMPATQWDAPKQQQQQEPVVYGDDDLYAERAERAEEREYQQQPIDRYATPQPGRYNTPAPDRYGTPQQQDRYATPQPPAAAASNPYRQELGNSNINVARNPYQYTAYGGGSKNNGNSWAPSGYGHSYAHSDAGSAQYGGHSRQASDDREHAPNGWL